MLADVELLVLPYSSAKGNSLFARLLAEFRGGGWMEFHAAIAFAKASGNLPDLLNAIDEFTESADHRLRLTFGADTFGAGGYGSDYEAIRRVLELLDGRDNTEVYLYRESRRTFHPKVYLFANREEDRALVIVGSSNWSEGGLVQNVEANVIVRLDLEEDDHNACFDQLLSYFDKYWSDKDG